MAKYKTTRQRVKSKAALSKMKNVFKKNLIKSKGKNKINIQPKKTKSKLRNKKMPIDDMKETELMTKLSTLMQSDTDAAEIYKNVIENIKEDERLIVELSSFRNDHLRHIDNLMQWITNSNSKKTAGIKGAIWSVYAKLYGSVRGTAGFLKALFSSEKMVQQHYREVNELTTDNKKLHQIISSNLEDEKKHIAYLEEQLRQLEKEEF